MFKKSIFFSIPGIFIYYLGLIIRNLKTYRNWTNFLYIPSSSPVQSSYHYSMGMKNTQKVLKTNPTQTKPVEHTLKNKHIRTQFPPNYQHTHTRQNKNPNFALKINTFTQVKSTLAGWLQKFTFLLLFIETLRKERRKITEIIPISLKGPNKKYGTRALNAIERMTKNCTK